MKQRKYNNFLQVEVKKRIKKMAKEMRANMPQKTPKVSATVEYLRVARNSGSVKADFGCPRPLKIETVRKEALSVWQNWHTKSDSDPRRYRGESS